jgi:hypothetical protein
LRDLKFARRWGTVRLTWRDAYAASCLCVGMPGNVRYRR